MTGSGKTAAFLLPILHALIGRPRGTTRALVLTPTRELAAQILADLTALAVHTPITAAAVYGGVGMGPQEHAFRSGVDVIVAHARPPARSFPRAVCASSPASSTSCSTKPTGCSTWAFCRTSGASCGTSPPSGRRCSSARRCRRRSRRSPGRCCASRCTIDVERPSAPADRDHAGRLSRGSQRLKAALLVRLLPSEIRDALVFTRTKHRANRLAVTWLGRHRVERIHGNRSQAQRTAGARRLQERQVPGARRHRYRGARHRRRRRSVTS